MKHVHLLGALLLATALCSTQAHAAWSNGMNIGGEPSIGEETYGPSSSSYTYTQPTAGTACGAWSMGHAGKFEPNAGGIMVCTPNWELSAGRPCILLGGGTGTWNASGQCIPHTVGSACTTSGPGVPDGQPGTYDQWGGCVYTPPPPPVYTPPTPVHVPTMVESCYLGTCQDAKRNDNSTQAIWLSSLDGSSNIGTCDLTGGYNATLSLDETTCVSTFHQICNIYEVDDIYTHTDKPVTNYMSACTTTMR